MEDNRLKKAGKLDGILSGLMYVLLGVYGIGCTFLYYMQSIQDPESEARYLSDLAKHISMIIDDGWYYSFTAVAFQVLYYLGGKTTILIAAFLGLMTVATVIATKELLRKLFWEEHQKKAFPTYFYMGMALALQFVMAFFFPYAGKYRYTSYQSGNLWHNSTYICMRLFSILAICLYYDLMQTYKEKLEVKKLLLFSINLFVCTGVKPSFLTVFAPIMALQLLWDLCHKVSFKNIFFFGLTVIPACFVVLWQNMVLFGEESESSISFRPWYTFSLHADRPKIAVICSLVFPLSVLGGSLLLFLYQRFLVKKNALAQKVFIGKNTGKIYAFLWSMTALGLATALCLAESGKRQRDGNFLWGYAIAIFLINVISFLVLVEQWRNRKTLVETQGLIGKCFQGIQILQILFLIYQSTGGIYFWMKLLAGDSYFY